MNTITTLEAAKLLKKNPSRIRQLVRAGILVPVTVGDHHSQHRFRKRDVQEYAKIPQKVGRKPSVHNNL